jgi:Cu+-exporting ATPase
MSSLSNKDLSIKEEIEGKCYHCGDRCTPGEIIAHGHSFCCNGCKSVYELLSSCGMDGYYTYADNPGIKQLKAKSQQAYAYLDAPAIEDKILSFKSDDLNKVRFRIPAMHCASCIWLIENFQKLVPGVITSRVNFLRREAQFSYHPAELSLRRLVEQLVAIGYEPEIHEEGDKHKTTSKFSRRLVYQIGVAGFCFGNIMLLSLPEYLHKGSTPDAAYRFFFGMVNLMLSLPVLLYSAQDYLSSAWHVIRQRQINLDVPISLGILALWIRSSYEIIAQGGGGYMDSLAALLFFLLIGKWFQQRTYDSLSFERDYKSYFPISVQRLEGKIESTCSIEELRPGDHFRVRSGELIPADALITEGEGAIDYSFVTGESEPVRVRCGEKVFAGGRQTGASLTLEALKAVNQSYLTSLWNDDAGQKGVHRLEAFADRVGRRFTYVVLVIAAVTTAYWLYFDPQVAWNALSAVLIIACPCALALSFPFAFGSAVRYLGRVGFYLKNGHALGKMAEVTDIVFDKTGTLTHGGQAEIDFEGTMPGKETLQDVQSIVAHSAHPLSRQLLQYLDGSKLTPTSAVSKPTHYEERSGEGIAATLSGKRYRLGSAIFAEAPHQDAHPMAAEVHLSVEGIYLGKFLIQKSQRPGVEALITHLRKRYGLFLLSGDNDASRPAMTRLFGQSEGLHFYQSPHDKKAFLQQMRRDGKVSAMIGDGLNDAGALSESDLGISVADDIFRFTPASDAILDAKQFGNLGAHFAFAKGVLKVVKMSFVLSFLYNGIGLFFAVQGALEPVIAAILMPISSITVVGFVSIGTGWLARKNLK